MNIQLAKNTLFYNSQCLFVEYHDIISCPWFALLYFIKDNENLKKNFELSEIENLDADGLFEWYVNRKHYNFYLDFPFIGDLTEYDTNNRDDVYYHYCNTLLEYQMNNLPELYDVDTTLSFSTVLRVINNDKKLIKRIKVYTEAKEINVEKQLMDLFGDKVEYVYGDLSEVLKTVPNDSTFVFADYQKVNILSELGKLQCASVILPGNFGYNIKDSSSFVVDFEKLMQEFTFKLDFFDNLAKTV